MVSYQGLSGWVEIQDGLEIVNVGGKLVLRATGGMASAPVWVTRAEVVQNTQADWVLMDPPLPDSLAITRNGSGLAEGEDWHITGQTVSFIGSNLPRVGDVLDFHYQK